MRRMFYYKKTTYKSHWSHVYFQFIRDNFHYKLSNNYFTVHISIHKSYR